MQKSAILIPYSVHIAKSEHCKGLVWRIFARAFTRFQKIVQCECSLNQAVIFIERNVMPNVELLPFVALPGVHFAVTNLDFRPRKSDVTHHQATLMATFLVKSRFAASIGPSHQLTHIQLSSKQTRPDL